MLDPEVIAKSLDTRDGSKLVAFREIGLPIFRMNCLVTLQEDGSLGAIEEFVLRCVSQEISTLGEMEAFLGLPPKIVSRQVGRLLYEGAVAQVDSIPPKYVLSQLGRTRLEQESSSRIVKEQIPIYVDGITRRVVAAFPQDLWSNAQLDSLDIGVIPPTPRRPPKPFEVDLLQINRMLALMADGDKPIRRAVRLDAVLGRVNVVFRRSMALAFKSEDGRQMSIAFAIDGLESEEHEIEYARSDDAVRSAIFGPLFNADVRRREIQRAHRELRTVVPEAKTWNEQVSGARPLLSMNKRSAEARSPAGENIVVLSVYDHPPLLKKALESAKRRLLIISPWIRANVVTIAFREQLIGCLQRDVEVTIAYGIGRDDPRERPSDVVAREALGDIAKKFPNLRFIRRKNTHAKVLLVDDLFFVTTSFNWLSFRGDPREPMREEEGTMVNDPKLVNEYYERLIGRIDVEEGGSPSA